MRHSVPTCTLACALFASSCSSTPTTDAPADGGSAALAPRPSVAALSTARAVLSRIAGRPAFVGLVRSDRTLEHGADGFHLAGPAAAVGAASFTLPERADGSVHVAVEGRADTWLDVAPLDVAAVTGTLEGNALVYGDAAPSLDLVYLADHGHLEEIRVLRDAAAPTTARYALRAGPGIATLRAREGRLEAVDATGYVRLSSAPIFAVDASGARRNADVSVEREGDRFVARVTLDPVGLAYPIAVDPGWSAQASLKYGRHSHAAALLTGGKVLVNGGVPGSGTEMSVSELYDPGTNVWAEVLPSKYGHSNHTLVPLAGNRALLVGSNSKIELYDVAANTWTEMTPRPTAVSDGHAAVALSGSTVLVMGGYPGPTTKVELFDAGTNAWTPRTDMPTGRAEFMTAAYAPGKILVAGGTTSTGVSATASIYDVGTNTWTATGSMLNARRQVGSVAVLTGNVVVVAGGYSGSDNLDAAERWTSASGTWAALPSLPSADAYQLTLTPIGTADVLIRGVSSAVYSASAAKWIPTTPVVVQNRGSHQTIALPSGKVLVIGGGATAASLSTTEVYDHVALGTACTGLTQCSMGACVDGRCCDEACTDTCKACDVTGKLGICSAVSGAPRASHGNCGSYLLCSAGACATTCNADSECASTHYCTGTGGTCALKKTQATACSGATQCQAGLFCTNGFCCNSATCAAGSSCGNAGALGTCTKNVGIGCTLGTECGSTFCVDGVCCADACTGTCSACSAAKKGAGANGTCGSVANGSDPDSECPGATCKDATTVSNAQVCNGAGACRATTDTPCTSGYSCSGGLCATSCTTDGQCAAGQFCNVNACVAKRDNGATCSAATQCKSGTCADSVCCDVACGGCNACSAAAKGSGVDGTCGPVAADRDPHEVCDPDVAYPASCRADGACDGAGSCRVYAKNSTSCDVTTCASATVVGKVCNGAGSCNPTSGTSCAPYGCNAGGTACSTACTKDTDCASTAFCTSSGTCLPKLANGTACGAGKECTSETCADGVCCDRACGGQCEACDLADKRGTCSAVSGAPHGTRAACAGGGTTCGGACDGMITAACSYPGGTAACGTTCDADKETRSACDGRGSCVAAAPISCGSYRCDGTTKCRDACSTNEHCAAGFSCDGSTCKPATPTCSVDLSSSTNPTDGRATACGVYLCDPSRGVCRDQCLTSSDCAAGGVCDSATKLCVGAPTSDDSGGCSTTAPRGGGAPAGLVSLVLAIAARRRRAARGGVATPERE